MAVVEAEIELATRSGTMRMFHAAPDNDRSYPVALMFQDGPGYREDLKVNARRFAAGGFRVLLPDLMYRFGSPVDLHHPNARAELWRRICEVLLNAEETFVADARQILEYADTNGLGDTSRVTTVGYCWGATAVMHLLAAMPGKAVAGAGFHPAWLAPDGEPLPMHVEGAPEPPIGTDMVPDRILATLDRVQGTLYVGAPASDRWISQASFAELSKAMAARHVAGELAIYPGTEHGFAVPGGPSWNAQACDRHVEQTLALWRASLG